MRAQMFNRELQGGPAEPAVSAILPESTNMDKSIRKEPTSISKDRPINYQGKNFQSLPSSPREIAYPETKDDENQNSTSPSNFATSFWNFNDMQGQDISR
jgi:hypothetical protein